MLHSTLHALQSAYAAFKAWRWVRQSEVELGSLRDRQLADLGIMRHEIPEVARHAVLTHS